MHRVSAAAGRAARRVAMTVAVFAVLVGLWELYRWIWSSTGWSRPFVVDSTSMPHVWTILKAFGQPAQVNQPALATVLFHMTLFTAKEAAFGFAIGAVVGFELERRADQAHPLAVDEHIGDVVVGGGDDPATLDQHRHGFSFRSTARF